MLHDIAEHDKFLGIIDRIKNFDIQNVENKEVISNPYKVFIENYFSDFVIEQQKEFVDRQLLKNISKLEESKDSQLQICNWEF